MGIQVPAEVKYVLIHEALRQDWNVLSISALCRTAGTSRSGYYAWTDAAPLRERREELDSSDFSLVKQAYEFRGYKKGARSIYNFVVTIRGKYVVDLDDSTIVHSEQGCHFISNAFIRKLKDATFVQSMSRRCFGTSGRNS